MTNKTGLSFFVKIGFNINKSSGTEVCPLIKKSDGSKISLFWWGRKNKAKRKIQYTEE